MSTIKALSVLLVLIVSSANHECRAMPYPYHPLEEAVRSTNASSVLVYTVGLACSMDYVLPLQFLQGILSRRPEFR